MFELTVPDLYVNGWPRNVQAWHWHWVIVIRKLNERDKIGYAKDMNKLRKCFYEKQQQLV